MTGIDTIYRKHSPFFQFSSFVTLSPKHHIPQALFPSFLENVFASVSNYTIKKLDLINHWLKFWHKIQSSVIVYWYLEVPKSVVSSKSLFFSWSLYFFNILFSNLRFCYNSIVVGPHAMKKSTFKNCVALCVTSGN